MPELTQHIGPRLFSSLHESEEFNLFYNVIYLQETFRISSQENVYILRAIFDFLKVNLISQPHFWKHLGPLSLIL